MARTCASAVPKWLTCGLWAIALTVGTCTASRGAAVRAFEFRAEVQGVPAELGPAKLGDVLGGRFSFDKGTPESTFDRGHYGGAVVDFELEGVIDSMDRSANLVAIQDNYGPFVLDQFTIFGNVFGPSYGSGIPVQLLLRLRDESGDGDTIHGSGLTAGLDFSEFSYGFIEVVYGGGGVGGILHARILEVLPARIPEPGSLALVVFAVLIAVRGVQLARAGAAAR